MKNGLTRVFRTLFSIAGWVVVISILWVVVLRFVPPPVTWAMVVQAKEQGEVKRTWKPLSAISSSMPLAVIAAEDQGFFDHHGFELEAIRKAIDHNQKSKRKRGASTISQQTAKNVFLWPSRTFVRKGLEVWFTVLIEGIWGKERILEVYLNVAETGKGRFGVESTAKACFKRSAAKLTSGQAALIAATLPSPRRYNACAPSAYVKRRQAWVQRQMYQIGNLMEPVERARIQELQERREKRKKR